jgi:SAM-dependent methyltransferase
VDDAPIDESDLYWSDQLASIHEGATRDHFLDSYNRRLSAEYLNLDQLSRVIIDVGCSSGYLLDDLHTRYPNARLAGLDYVYAGLETARASSPESSLTQGDARHLPFGTATADGMVSTNLLEHVPDDRSALREMFRVLKPGSRAVVVVPANAKLFDYYDRYLHHQRRYSRSELRHKAEDAGFTVRENLFIGSIIFPAFWLVKKLNRLRFKDLEGAALNARVEEDIRHATNSRAGAFLTDIEAGLVRRGILLPFGIRELIVLERPSS